MNTYTDFIKTICNINVTYIGVDKCFKVCDNSQYTHAFGNIFRVRKRGVYEMIKEEKFDWGSFIKKLSAIAIPVAFQNLLTTTGSMVDTMMIAPLGEASVGAVGLCAQFSVLMFAAYWGFVGGGMLFFAQYWGAGDDDGIYRSYGTTLMCLVTVGVIFAFLGIFMPEFIMSVYTDKASIQKIGCEYLSVVGFSYPITIISVGMSALLRSTGKVKIPLYASIASVATNICLNWVFIYGHFGFPQMEVRGAALATVCASAVNVSVMLVISRIQGVPYFFHLGRCFRQTKVWLAEYFKKCFPIACNEVLIGVGNMIINVALGRQNERVIAAIAVFRTLEGLVIAFFSGFSNASSVLVGKNVGAGNLEKAYERAKRLVFLCCGCIAVVCFTLVAVHTPLLTVMSLSGESFRAATVLLCIYSVYAILRMGNWVQNDTYRSAGDAAYGTVLEISFMYIMVLPCVCLSAFYFKAPYYIIFACCYIDEPIRFLLMQRHMYSGKWIKPVTENGKEALEEFFDKRRRKAAL